MTMRKANAAILMLFLVSATSAKELVFNLYPPDYAETCKKYADLTEKGQTVKAERLAEKYRKHYIHPSFMMKPAEVRAFRITNPYGWYPTNVGTEYDLRPLEDVSPEESNIPHTFSSRIGVKIRKADLEKWQDFVLKNFPDPEPGETPNYQKYISEVFVSIKNSAYEGRSVISDCFDPKVRSSKFDLNGWDEEITLISYKLTERKIIPEKEKPRDNSASFDENMKSETEQPPETSPKKPSSGSPIIDIISSQQSDRYEVVREILRKEPGQANGLAMSFKFTIYQQGKMVDQSEPTMYAINAAIRMKDFEMVKLLVDHGAKICWNNHVLSPTSECAIRYAAENGTPAIHQYLKDKYRKESDESVFLVVFGSDLPPDERVKACEELTERLGYEEGAKGVEQKKKTKALCPTTKEFMTRKIRPGMRVISK